MSFLTKQAVLMRRSIVLSLPGLVLQNYFQLKFLPFIRETLKLYLAQVFEGSLTLAKILGKKSWQYHNAIMPPLRALTFVGGTTQMGSLL